MELPGRLRSTTLGDLLGACHRARATGTLELAEDRGRVHRVYLSAGLVAAVELDGASAPLAEILRAVRAADDDVLQRSLLRAMASSRLHGQVLIDDFRLSPEVVGNALRRQILGRLAALERLGDARVSFRVAMRPPRNVLGGSEVRARPLHPSEFLHGRRRLRDRDAGPSCGPRSPASEGPWQVLGLRPGAEVTEIKRAFRRLVKSLHPDLHPHATPEERDLLETRFARVTEAYRTLVA
jgi:DnaJ-domain-containing protein 1